MSFDPDAYRQALELAGRSHAEQKTPTGLPYVVHLSCVAMELIRALRAEPGHDETFAVTCALLHDVLEDTPTPASEIGAVFGARVLEGVQALTKNAALEKDVLMQDSLERIRRQPPEISMVKLADRITNLAPPPAHWTKMKIAAYRVEAQSILDALGGASPFLAARLRQRIESYPPVRPTGARS